MIHIVEIKLLLLLGNRLKHIRGNVRYLVTWNIKEFTVGYLLALELIRDLFNQPEIGRRLNGMWPEDLVR
jgi:hypothetical protein